MTDLRVIIPASAEPLTLAEARYHLRLTVERDDGAVLEDDPYVLGLLPVARQAAENYLGRPIARAIYELRAPRFDEPLPVSPVEEVLSVRYLDGAGVLQDLDPLDWELAGTVDAPRLRPAYGTAWPGDLRRLDDTVRVRFVAGYGGAVPLPAPIRQAMLMILAHLFENRESISAVSLQEVPMGAGFLLNPYRFGLGV